MKYVTNFSGLNMVIYFKFEDEEKPSHEIQEEVTQAYNLVKLSELNKIKNLTNNELNVVAEDDSLSLLHIPGDVLEITLTKNIIDLQIDSSEFIQSEDKLDFFENVIFNNKELIWELFDMITRNSSKLSTKIHLHYYLKYEFDLDAADLKTKLGIDTQYIYSNDKIQLKQRSSFYEFEFNDFTGYIIFETDETQDPQDLTTIIFELVEEYENMDTFTAKGIYGQLDLVVSNFGDEFLE